MSKPKPKHTRPEPIKVAQRDVPELDPATTVKFGRGAAGLRNGIDFMHAVKGRPKAGSTPAGSSTRSLRLTDDAWAALAQRAEQLGMPLHKLLRVIIATWLYGDTGAKKMIKPRKRRKAA